MPSWISWLQGNAIDSSPRVCPPHHQANFPVVEAAGPLCACWETDWTEGIVSHPPPTQPHRPGRWIRLWSTLEEAAAGEGNNTTWDWLAAHPSHNLSQSRACRSGVDPQRKYLERDVGSLKTIWLWHTEIMAVVSLHHNNVSGPQPCCAFVFSPNGE